MARLYSDGRFQLYHVAWSMSHGSSSASQQFVNYADDGFLTQHVTDWTCNGKILDLVFTSDMIYSVTVLSSLANSDHNMLEWGMSSSVLHPHF